MRAPARPCRATRYAALAILLSTAALAHADDVTDPAPPIVHALDGRAPAVATKTPELTTHATPRPLGVNVATGAWPGLLGPHQNGHSPETNLRTDFDADPPTLLWSYDIGSGYAAPSIAEGRVVLVHRVSNAMHIDCLDADTGLRFWRHTHPCEYRGDYISNNGSRAAPVIADGRVFVHSVEGWLYCFDLTTGQVIWQRNPTVEFEVGDHFFGVVASPVVYGSLLIQNIGAPQELGGATVMAFDTTTGRVVWATGSRWGPSCASPVIATLHGRDRLFVMGGGKSRPPAGGLMVLEPDTGKLILEHPFRGRTFESVLGANPVVVGGDTVYLTSSYNTGTARIDVAEDGTFVERWRDRGIGVQFATPLFLGDHLYLIDGRSDRAGAIVCLDPESGEERSRTDVVWDEEVVYQDELKTVEMSIGEGSMIYVQRRMLVLGDNGHLLWVDPDPDGATVTSRTSLFRANESWTPPALSRGLLYVRQNRRERFGEDRQPARLMCFDLRIATGD